MGLFEKKECMLCGGKAGLLSTKFSDGVLCNKCYGTFAYEFLAKRDTEANDPFKFKNISVYQALFGQS